MSRSKRFPQGPWHLATGGRHAARVTSTRRATRPAHPRQHRPQPARCAGRCADDGYRDAAHVLTQRAILERRLRGVAARYAYVQARVQAAAGTRPVLHGRTVGRARRRCAHRHHVRSPRRGDHLRGNGPRLRAAAGAGGAAGVTGKARGATARRIAMRLTAPLADHRRRGGS